MKNRMRRCRRRQLELGGLCCLYCIKKSLRPVTAYGLRLKALDHSRLRRFLARTGCVTRLAPWYSL